MPADDAGSVTIWLGALKAGELAAAQPLWERYFDRLVHRVRARLRATSRQGAADEEDAALSAFDSFCAGVARNRFPQLDDRDDLWRLLVCLAVRKTVDQARRAGRLKRGGGRILGEATLGGPGEPKGATGLDGLIGPEPTPEFAAMVAEEHRRLLAILDDETLRRIALRKMEGYTLKEIAADLGCARRSVVRKLQLIRRRWERT
jgi:DNA-directed RNA polymerase specialized sigma24 family protein